MTKCDFVDPTYNFPCGKKASTKIVINTPNRKEPIVRFACERHGDERFNWLSSSEIRITNQKDKNQIDYKKFQDEMRKIRWKNCRRCSGEFIANDVQCCLEYYWLSDLKVALRRSFLLHMDCLKSELRFYEINKTNSVVNATLDSVLS